MKSRINISIPLIIIGVLSTTLAQADYEYDYLSDLLSREHREASDADDWIERGNATVTVSPRFEDGIRLTAWGGAYNKEDDHEFAIASAVYFFEVPRQAQYIELLVRYRGEPHDAELEGQEKVVGRVWIRNTKREYARRRHYDDKHADETRYGDTFFLRAKRRSETIKIAAAGHVDDGFLEMHIVVEDGEQLDVEHIDLLTYQRQPDFRVVHRYDRSYHWKPWHRYTYHYFYDGPFYYCTDLDYYIRWSYPIYDRRYLSIRYDFGNYLHRYYTHYPRYYYRSYSNRVNVHVHTNNRVKTHRRSFNRWSEEHETVRHQYNRSRLSRTVGGKRNSDVRKRVRAVIAKHHQESIPAGPAQRSIAPGKRRSFETKTKTEFNPTTRRRSQYSRQSRVSSGPRYRPSNQQYQSQKDNRRSNNERRNRLYTRSRISRGSSSTPPSRYKSSSSRTTSRTRSQSSSTSRTRTSSSRQSSSRTTSRSNDDDEGQNARQSERSRNTSRTKRNSRRK